MPDHGKDQPFDRANTLRVPQIVLVCLVLSSTPAGAENAGWYGRRFQGHRTASGERYDADALTAAHRSLPFGTKVRVTNRSNGRAVVVRITDRGPFTPGRAIDLSAGAARAIGMSGVGSVTLAVER